MRSNSRAGLEHIELTNCSFDKEPITIAMSEIQKPST